MRMQEKRPRPIPGTIGLAFGGLWFGLGAAGLPKSLQLPVIALGALITVALITALWKRGGEAGSGNGLFRRRAYIVAVALEVIALYTASAVLSRYGLTRYVIQATGVIVGLHFIGLWQASRLPRFLWIAGGMVAVSALSALLPTAMNGLDPRDMATGFGNALVLWLGAGRAPKRA